MQVALDDQTECSGGSLCFFVNNPLLELDRPDGSACQHTRAVMHTVTALLKGTRKSLFVVDQSNGPGLNGVFTVQLDTLKSDYYRMVRRTTATIKRQNAIEMLSALDQTHSRH